MNVLFPNCIPFLSLSFFTIFGMFHKKALNNANKLLTIKLLGNIKN